MGRLSDPTPTHPTHHRPDIDDPVQEFEHLLRRVVNVSTTNPAQALTTAKLAARAYRTSETPWLHMRTLFLCVEQCYYLGRFKEMKQYVDQAQRASRTLTDPHERGEYLTLLGTYRMIEGDYKKAYVLLSQARQLFADSGYHGKLYGQTLRSLSIISELSGDLHTALAYALQGLEVVEAFEHCRPLANCLYGIGRLYTTMHLFGHARAYFDRALALHRSYGDLRAVAEMLEGIGMLHLNRNDPIKALQSLQEALEALDSAGENCLRTQCLLSMGWTYCLMEAPHEALRCSEEIAGLVETDETWNDAKASTLQLIIASARYALNDITEAYEAANRSIDLSEACESPDLARRAHGLMAQILERRGDAAGALRHLKRQHELQERLFSIEQQREFAEVEMRHTLAGAVREHQELQRRARLSEHEAQQKSIELNSLTLKVVRHDAALRRLRDLVRSHAPDIGREVERLASTDGQTVGQEEWRIIEKEFELSHREFIQRLRERCADLTAKEVRICVMIRLGLENKQIADALFLALDTIKTHRRNIRRKLNLHGVNLRAILMSISGSCALREESADTGSLQEVGGSPHHKDRQQTSSSTSR